MHRIMLIPLACLAFALAVVAQEVSKTVKLAEAPPKVQQAFQAQLKGGKLGEITRTDDDGDISFDAEITRDNEEWSVTVAEDGKLLALEIPLAATPEPVRKTIATQLGKGHLDNITKTIDQNEVSYDVEYTNPAGLARNFSVAPDGKVTSLQMELSGTSAAVQKSIQTAAANGELGDIYRYVDAGVVTYDFMVTKGGKAREISLSESGRLESEEVFLEETPPAVRATINTQLGDGKLGRIDKIFAAGGAVTFQVEARKNHKAFDFSVGPRGRFLGMDN